MYEPSQHAFPQLAFLWPALAAASASEAAALVARQFAELAVGDAAEAAGPEPAWTTPNQIVLDLQTVRLRDFSTAGTGMPTLLCAPFALHGATIADLAPDHSLVAALRAAGLAQLYVTDWRSADDSMRNLGVDDYLAAFNVVVDALGGTVDLVGLCQGGSLALIYAARFPDKVRKLAIAGTPVDVAAAPSGLSDLIASTPAAVLAELVQLGGGRVIGRKVQQVWGPEAVGAEDIHRTLQTDTPIDSDAFPVLQRRFRDWYAWTVNLPGSYYLDAIERLFRRNELARGGFVALGKRIDLACLRTPLYLLAARDDELVAPAQLFALAHLTGAVPAEIHTALAPCGHLGLFMGRNVLREHWPRVAQWLKESDGGRR